MTSQVKNSLGWTDEEISDLCASLNIDKASEKNVLSLVVSTEEWANIPKIKDAVQYLGFDARAIVAQFFKKANDRPRATADVPLTVAEFTIYEKNDAKTDLLFFLTVFLERGNNIGKAVLRCDERVGSLLKAKASAYGITIEKGQNKNILGTKHLTLARLAQAFAPQTAAIIIAHSIPGKLQSKIFPVLPLLMQHTVFPAFVPTTGRFATDLKDIANVLNAEMSYMLADAKSKRKMANASFEELLDQSVQFVDAAINGSLMTDEIKIKVLKKAGVITLNEDVIVMLKVGVWWK